MTADPSFSDILAASSKGWCARKGEEGLLSIALPIKKADPLEALRVIAEENQFRFLWDEEPGRSFAASGCCQQIELAGPKRFELAQRFSDATFGKLTNGTPNAPSQARPKIVFAFAFFEQAIERLENLGVKPAVQAILPKWQLSLHNNSCWLRLNGVVTHEADARESAEKLWLMRERLIAHKKNLITNPIYKTNDPTNNLHWEEYYKPALEKGLELINNGQLHKLVLAVRQSIKLQETLDPLNLLYRLRTYQQGTCRFLWQPKQGEAFFGASPERLLSVNNELLQCDALAGTASKSDDGERLMQSKKDRLEHELVVQTITNQLNQEGLNPKKANNPQLAKFGKLIHLHTPITAKYKGKTPLLLAEKLHPTPAVAGLPQREAIAWLRILEPFERGNYAAPIGWMDNEGDIDLRVAIRCGTARGNILNLTAGAGLVKGSIADKELDEVGLKLAVLADQLTFQSDFQKNSSNNNP